MSELLVATIVGLGAGALGALLTNRSAKAARIVGCGGALLGSIFALGFGLAGLAGGSLRLYFPDLLPIGGAALGIDRLSAFFLVMIAVAAIPAALYGIGYTRAYEGNHSLGGMGFAFNTFIAAMILVPLAQNVLTFLALWEVMLLAATTDNLGVMWVAIEATTLATVFLVNLRGSRTSLEAAYKYLILSSVGIALAFIGTALVYYAGAAKAGEVAVDWSALNAAAASLNPDVMRLAFVFIVIGYGTKAGLAPMHTWLPDAHSEAPAPISALMSGVLLNIGLYAVLRFKAVVDLNVGSQFSGGLLLGVGLLSLAVAAAFLVRPRNYKRMWIAAR